MPGTWLRWLVSDGQSALQERGFRSSWPCRSDHGRPGWSRR